MPVCAREVRPQHFAALLIFCIICPTSITAASNTTQAVANQLLVDCYNNPPASLVTGTVPSSTLSSYLRFLPARLHLHTVLASTRGAPTPSQHPHAASPASPASSAAPPALTIISAVTLSRIAMLESQCQSWAGPLVSAWWLPLPVWKLHTSQPGPGGRHLHGTSGQWARSGAAEADAVQQALQHELAAAQALHARMEALPTACALTLLVLTERLEEQVLELLAPLNSLRNAALLAVQTPLVAMVDADFQLTRAISQYWEAPPSPGRADKALLLGALVTVKKVLVLPAFDMCQGITADPTDTVHAAVAGPKARLLRLVKGKKVCWFKQHHYPPSHASTNYTRWYATPMDQAPYPVPFMPMYEPWFIAGRQHYPLFDSRFRGYGHDKQTQVAYASREFGFLVDPEWYIMHTPHPPSTSSLLWNNRSANTASLAEGRALVKATGAALPGASATNLTALQAVRIVNWLPRWLGMAEHDKLRQGIYVVHLDPGVHHCMATLPWWRGTPAAAVAAAAVRPWQHSQRHRG